MLERTKKQITGDFVDLNVRVPASRVEGLKRIVHGMDGSVAEHEELLPPEEVVPGRTPGRLLRAARNREDLTRQQLANAIGVLKHHISEMEHDKRTITPDMAKRLGDFLRVSYKLFL